MPPLPATIERGRTKLVPSDTFANSRDCTKYVEKDYVLGYVVVGEGRGGGAKVWPIYRGEVHVNGKDRRGKPMRYVFSTYEQGMPLNGQYYEDPEGARLAVIASHAIAALDERERTRGVPKPPKGITRVKSKPKAKKAAKKKAKPKKTKAPERVRQDNASGPGN